MADAARLWALGFARGRRGGSVLLGIDQGRCVLTGSTRSCIRRPARSPRRACSATRRSAAGLGAHFCPRGMGARRANRGDLEVTERGLPLRTAASAGSPPTRCLPASKRGLARETAESPQERGLADLQDSPDEAGVRLMRRRIPAARGRTGVCADLVLPLVTGVCDRGTARVLLEVCEDGEDASVVVGPGWEVKLCEDVADVRFDSFGSQPQVLADGPIGQSLGEERQDLAFAFGQLVEDGPGARPSGSAATATCGRRPGRGWSVQSRASASSVWPGDRLRPHALRRCGSCRFVATMSCRRRRSTLPCQLRGSVSRKITWRGCLLGASRFPKRQITCSVVSVRPGVGTTQATGISPSCSSRLADHGRFADLGVQSLSTRSQGRWGRRLSRRR